MLVSHSNVYWQFSVLASTWDVRILMQSLCSCASLVNVCLRVRVLIVNSFLVYRFLVNLSRLYLVFPICSLINVVMDLFSSRLDNNLLSFLHVGWSFGINLVVNKGFLRVRTPTS